MTPEALIKGHVLPGPGGVFSLRRLGNPGACPQCGRFTKEMWWFLPDNDYRRAHVVCCPSCAEKRRKK